MLASDWLSRLWSLDPPTFYTDLRRCNFRFVLSCNRPKRNVDEQVYRPSDRMAKTYAGCVGSALNEDYKTGTD